ncbi:E3 ubiquitin-protein ligase HUWE1 isoform X18 [Equus przewalskii]|uniref:HECT-type E3 ubiquitin transferase n=1 Tax=Equus przewalskii TaxID=9798 RepID=A0ABM4N9K5_EQUPR
MKVDRTKLKKTPTEAPADCRALIDKLKVCNDEQLLLELQQIKTWNIGKCELYHWVDLLDRFDGILADAGQTVENMSWMLVCDRPEREQLKMLLLAVLNFTALLIEYSFSRHLYSSIEHLTTLLASSDMQVVLAVLNLLYVFSKRSNYITRLGSDKRTPLLTRLQHLAESWGGKENGFGLAECCRDLHMMKYPPSATTLHFEFYADPGAEVKIEKRTTSNTLHYIHIEQLDKISESPSEIMESLTKMYSIPKDKQMLLFTHIRLAHGFSNHRKRLQAVQARLHAISILVYSNALQESANSILYNGLIEELVDVLQITDKQLMEIKAASLRTLTSIVHLERTPKLSSIIDCTGTASYHGFLPVLVRNCIQAMIDPSMDPYPHQFATALFSFLYHLASYDAGGEALVSCGMMEALLKVIKFLGDEQDQITFVTRAVRVVDLITNLDMAAFQSHSGLSIFIYRLEHEVDLCRKECPFVIKPKIQRPSTTQEGEEMETDMDVADVTMESSSGLSISMEHRLDVELRAGPSSSTSISSGPGPRPGVQCIPQRAALLKSMLNFLKKAIQDPAFSDGIRHVMDGSLPTSLKHIISNAEYYGPSLFLLATEVVTVFVFQEPSLLSSLQDNGLTDVMLHALLIKDVPATREVLGSLPNVFSALCLNARGLQSFVQCQPFERLFKVLLSPDYLPAMRRRRSSDPLGDTASNLGSAVDELMRHQPTLKTDATTAIIKLLEEICNLGRDPKYICQKPSIQKADGTATAPPPRSNHAAEEASSEDEEEEEVQAMQSFNSAQQNETEPNQQVVGTEERIPIPLMDYILNVMKFVESILSNNTTDDHCQEFVNQKGLLPLVTILGLPNLPIDFPTSAACQAVAGVCKSILTLSHEPKVLQEGLLQLDSILSSLEPLHRPIESPGGSVLLRELACAGNVADATLSAQATPLLHALTAAHAYIMMFVHTCRVGQSEIRSISVNQWGSQLGLSVLSKLSQLYCSLVWESTVLLSLCTPNSLPSGCEFGQADMQKLVPKDEKAGTTQGGKRSDGEQDGTAGSMDASTQGLLEGIGLDGDTLAPMETDEPTTSDSKGKSKITPAMAARIKQIKPLLSASSRLGRALAELFGLLVKLCVGSPVRQRRSHHAASTTTAPTPAARSTASALTKLLTKGLSWQPPPYTPTPRFRLTFFICSVGFTSPMLFDERKYPYHLMLQKFLCSGGHNALFETFNWALSMGGKVPVAEGLEHSELPDGTGEFLDAWLMLVEKMVNPTTVLESPHSLPAKLPGGVQNFPQFSALRFLVVTQKAAFTCIKNLWNRKPLKVYGGRMAESMLAILCHILRGEPVIRERLSKEKEGSRGEEDTGQEEGGSRREPQVNQQQLQQLMDMGFTREHAMEALLNTSTMEQATEYLLTHPPPIMGGVVRDLSMSEEDQMMRAIAMSLGQDIPMDQRAESPEEVACRKEEEERKAREKQEEEEAKCLEKFQDADPLEQDELHTFTDTMLPGCFHLLDELPDTVYRVCDLIMTAIKRNGADYRDMILKQVVNQVWEAADVLIKAALPLTTSDTKTVSEWISQMATLPQASNLATRILLLTLLFEELKLPCAWVVESSGILNVLIKLLEVVQPCLQAAKEQKEVQTPKWITPVLLLIDFYEKTAISSKRRAQMTKYLQSNNNNWRWFDDRSGRWCSYSASNNSTIDSAWKSGETSVRFTAGRRRYTVQFTTMVQVNEETGNRRPVMLTLLRVPRLNKNSKNSNGQELEKTLEESKEMDIKRKENKANDTPLALESTNIEKETSLEETKIGEILIQGLTEDMVTVLIRACVSMLGVPVDPDTLHATLRLCLRLTRDHKYAMMFAELKSTRMILNLTQSSGFNGFTPLVTLLLRHIIEDPCTLRHTMEKVVRSAATSGAGSTTSGVVSGSLGSREINYILRVLGPAACRNPDIFTEVANCCIRIALPAPRGSGTASDDEFENLRIKGPNAVQLVKTTPLKPSPLPVIPDTIKEVIYDMLNALAAYHAPEEADKSDPKPGGMTQEVGQLLQDMGDDVYQQYRSLTRQSSDFDTQSGFSLNSQVFAADGTSTETSTSGATQGEASTPEESRDGKKDKEGDRASEEGKQKGKGSKPLMPTSTILRLLAELVRSYVGIATLIANYSYTVGQSELIKEDCSVLAFVLDHLLPHTQNAEDKDTPALARLFLASLAAAGSGTDAQVALVNEVKAALGRALAMAESTEKHARLQAVMCIISTIMESCPSTSSFYSSATAKTQHNGMNNIIRLFLKKGLVNDLARVPHSLDLSSPNMANTVNAALKPLETLSRIVNQPSSLFGSKSASSKSKSEQDAQGASQDSNSNQQDPGEPGEAEVQEEDHDVTQTEVADGDIMDGEAETDSVVIAGQPEVLSSQEMQVENELEDLIDELLERDGGSGNSTIIADIPPSPGNIPTTHPLMVRHADHSSLTLGSGSSTTRLTQGIGRSQRTLRQLTANTGHTIHVHYPGNRQPNPPLILQRLLGPSAAADILQLSSSLPLQSRGRARLLVGNDDVHIIARSDDELLDDFFHDQSTATSQAGTLSSIPTALTRWTEECKVLDAESMHDCVSVVKVPIVNHLEFLRDEELEERREKRRKQLAEEETKITDKGKEDKENRDQSAQCTASKTNDSTEQNLSDGTPMPDSYPTTPSSTDAATSEPKETLVTLQPSQQPPTLPPPPALGEIPQELQSPAGERGSSTQLLMPVEPEELGPTRPSGEAETTQMELSPAPTIKRAEDSDALTAVSSQLEGSPMDTSSLASCTLEEAVGDTSAAGSSEQPTAGSSTPGDAPPVVTELQGGGDESGEPAQPPEDSSPPASSESSSTRDSAVAISGADSRGILEEPLPSTSSEEEDPLAGISLPEGVDPSFLAALPDDIRREVLQNQLGIRPPTRTAPSTNSSAPAVVGNPGVTEVSPEFLAALPPAIQEEVLAQQRAEQQRRELAQNASSDTPMDPVTFIQTLPSDLRRSVLEDMEDSVLAVMPPDIAAEAQALRREQEARQRQLMHERLFGHSSTSALSAILRSPAFTSRLSGNRGVQYTRLAVQRGGTFQMGGSSSHNRPSGSNVDTLLRLRGRLLLDHEALSCLLVLLFVDEPKLNTSRLHRVLRNLCYHAQTRHWVIRSLLSILQRSSESELCIETPKLSSSEEKGKKSSKSCGSSSHENRPLDLLHKMESKSSNQLSWLSVSMDAALGCRTNIFQIQRSGGRKHTEKHASSGSTVHIHPQAAPVVCRHVLDTLIQLAKVFPSHFTQQRTKETNCESDRERGSKQTCSPCSSQPNSSGICTDFWDLLVKLDNMNVSRKGKNSVKSVPVSASGEGETSPYSLEASPLGQLMNMLSHPVIRRSSLLTEKLLRLLSLISIALPENKVSEAQTNSGSSASSTTVTTSTTSTTTTTAASSTPTPATATTPVTSAPALVAATAISTIAVAASTTVTTPTTATTTVSTCTTTKASKSPAKVGDGGSSSADFKMVSSGLTENQLQLSVEVLTSHSCSEEGLEDAANVLLQLSRGDSGTRDTVLKLLLNGARHLGYTLCKQIGTLLAELREYNLEQQRRAQCETLSPDGLPEEQPQTTKLKGKMQSRFDMAENVVIVASQKRPLGGRELQLPSMSMLTSKTSTQKFFLRVLQVIIQLRDDTRRANKKAKQTGRLGSSGLGSASSIQAAVRQLEAEADAIIQMSESSQSEASVRREESPMDVDQPSPSAQDTQSIGSDGALQGEKEKEERPPELPLLSEQLSLDELWDMLGECLKELEESHDQHAVLVLQPAVEAFFLVHATERESKPPVRDTRESQLAHIKDEPPPLSPAPLTPATPSSLDPFFSREPSSMHISSSLPPDTQKFLRFAETHRTVLNQILRQSTTHLADGPFAVLVDYIRVLDFDVKRKYFRQELERLDEGLRKEDMAVHVRRDHVFEDSYRELHRKSPEEMKNRLYIVFEGEEGQDAGGLLREWYMIISREMFNPMYALFRTSPGDRVTYTINPSSHCNPNHLSYFKFVGRIVAKAVYDNRLLECYFTRSFYKHILGKSVRYTDMESEDYHFYQGLVYLLENDVSTLGYDLTFSTEVQEFGVCEVRDLKPNGANILVTEENKKEYVHLVCQMRMTGAIRKQLAAFLEGFYEIIPKRLISIFTEQELELLISGLPTIDIDDLKSNTEYHKYQSNSIQIQWFWRALRSFDQADRAKFLQFVTGTSKVPLQGFAALEGMNGIQKFQIHRDDRSTDRLPSAHTCFNQLDLPAYESFEKLRHMLLLAIQECSEGFGLA